MSTLPSTLSLFIFVFALQGICCQIHSMDLVLVGIGPDPKPRRIGGCELELVPIGKPNPTRIGNLICGYPAGAVIDGLSGILVLHGPAMEGDLQGAQVTRVQVGKITKIDSVRIPEQSIESAWISSVKAGKVACFRRYAMADLSPTGQLKPGAVHFMALTMDGLTIPTPEVDPDSPPIGSGSTTEEGDFGSEAFPIKCEEDGTISALKSGTNIPDEGISIPSLPPGLIKREVRSGTIVRGENGSLALDLEGERSGNGVAELIIFSSLEKSWGKAIEICTNANPFFIGSILIVPATAKKLVDKEEVRTRNGSYTVYDTDHKLEWKLALVSAEEIIGTVDGDLIVFDTRSDGAEPQKVYRIEKITAKKTLIYSPIHFWYHAYCMKSYEGIEKCLVNIPGIVSP